MEGYVVAAAATDVAVLRQLVMKMMLMLSDTELQEIASLRLRERGFQQWFSYKT